MRARMMPGAWFLPNKLNTTYYRSTPLALIALKSANSPTIIKKPGEITFALATATPIPVIGYY